MSGSKIGAVVIVSAVIVLAVIFAVTRVTTEAEPEDFILTLRMSGEEIQVDLTERPVYMFEGSQKRQEADPTLHSFTGIPLHALLEEAGVPMTGLPFVTVIGEDGQQILLEGDEVNRQDNIYLAVTMDEEALLSLDGTAHRPMLVVLRDEFSTRWIRHVTAIEIGE